MSSRLPRSGWLRPSLETGLDERHLPIFLLFDVSSDVPSGAHQDFPDRKANTAKWRPFSRRAAYPGREDDLIPEGMVDSESTAILHDIIRSLEQDRLLRKSILLGIVPFDDDAALLEGELQGLSSARHALRLGRRGRRLDRALDVVRQALQVGVLQPARSTRRGDLPATAFVFLRGEPSANDRQSERGWQQARSKVLPRDAGGIAGPGEPFLHSICAVGLSSFVEDETLRAISTGVALRTLRRPTDWGYLIDAVLTNNLLRGQDRGATDGETSAVVLPEEFRTSALTWTSS